MELTHPVAPLFAGAALASILAAAIMWPRRRATPAAGAMTVALLGVSWWSIARMGTVLASSTDLKMALDLAIYPGVAASVAGFFAYCLAMADGAWTLTRRTALLLSIEPVLIVLAAATNPWHHAVLTSWGLTGGSHPLLQVRQGPVFWGHTVYTYTLLACGILTLVRAYLHAPSSHRWQFGWPLVAVVPPMAGNLITLFGFPQAQAIGLTPVFFTVSAGACCWALFRRALPDVVPVAGRQILETIGEAVLVVDRHWRVLELNPAAEALRRRLSPQSPGRVVGAPAAEMFGLGRRPTSGEELELTAADGSRLDLHVRVTPLHNRRDQLIGWVLVGHDVTERNRQRAELHAANGQLREQLRAVELLRAELAEQAVRDVLTGLHNRRFLVDTLARDVEAARAADGPLSVIMLDIDHFKAINDRYGHTAGDNVIVTVAARLAEAVADGETAARYGGEEFLVVLPGCPAPAAAQRAEAVRRACAAVPIPVNGEDVLVTVSAGVAALRPGDHAPDLVDAADRALYAAKSAGRNRVEVADPVRLADAPS